jgi:phage shock protein B
MSPFIFIIILAAMAFGFVLILERMEIAKEQAAGLSAEEAAEMERSMVRMAERIETLETLLAERHQEARY